MKSITTLPLAVCLLLAGASTLSAQCLPCFEGDLAADGSTHVLDGVFPSSACQADASRNGYEWRVTSSVPLEVRGTFLAELGASGRLGIWDSTCNAIYLSGASNVNRLIPAGTHFIRAIGLEGFVYRLSLSFTPVGPALYVDATSSAPPNGYGWATAYPDLQEALARAETLNASLPGFPPTITEIWVARGTYTPSQVADPSEAFVMIPNVSLYGGFAGTEVTRDERDVAANETILSANIGLPDDSDNSFRVVEATSGAGFFGPEVSLDGFTIEGGRNDSTRPGSSVFRGNGGGLVVSFVNPTIARCTFRYNVVEFGGGAVFISDANPRFRRCTFFRNETKPQLVGSLGGRGGAVLVNGPTNGFQLTPVFVDCEFTDNRAAQGGAIAVLNNGSTPHATVVDSVFQGNVASSEGGAIHCDEAHATAIGCLFASNSADNGTNAGSGGAIRNFGSGSRLTLESCTLTGNFARSNGGAVFLSYPVAQCTAGGPALATIRNSVLWGNSRAAGFVDGAQIFDGGNFVCIDVNSSCLQVSPLRLAVIGGVGNINLDPRFRRQPLPNAPFDPEEIDVRLQANSPCRNAGSNAALPQDVHDADGDGDTTELAPDLFGHPRINDVDGVARVDMGAVEYHLDNDEDDVIQILDNCPQFANPGQEDSDGDGVGDACVPHDISVTPTGGKAGDVVTIQARGIVTEFAPVRVKLTDTVGGESADGTVLDIDELSPGLFALSVRIPTPPAPDTMFVNVRINTTVRTSPTTGAFGDLPNGFAYTDQRLSVGDRVGQFAPLVTPPLAPTVLSGAVWEEAGAMYVVAQGSSAPLINWSNGTVSIDVTYSVSYAPSPVIDIAAETGAALPADLDPSRDHGVFNVAGLNENAALGVIYRDQAGASNRVWALDPGGADPDAMHVVVFYRTAADARRFATYEVVPGTGYAGIVLGAPHFQVGRDVGEELRGFYPINALLDCVLPFPESSTGAPAPVELFTQVGRARFWQSSADRRIFAVNRHADPVFASSVVVRWPRVDTVRGAGGVWTPFCAGIDLADTAYAIEYELSWPQGSPVVDVSAATGAALPVDLGSDEQVFDVADKKENVEQGLIYDDGAGPRVYATNVRCTTTCAGDPAQQHVLLRYRRPDGELAFQVYDLEPGAFYDDVTGRMFVAPMAVGQQLEPIFPLDALLRQRNTTLGDENIVLSGHATVWKNPARGHLHEVWSVNAHPATGGTVLISWPRVLTSKGPDGKWNVIEVYDPSPERAPYVQEFPVSWGALADTVIASELGADLPVGWQVGPLGEDFDVARVGVFHAPYAGRAGNLNDEHALVYRKKSITFADDGFVGDWAVFSLLPAAGALVDGTYAEGGESWVLVSIGWDDGSVEFASYKVEPGTIDRTVPVGSRLAPYYPLDEILYGRRLTFPAPLDRHIEPLAGSTGWWISDLRGLIPARTGSHIYAVNKGNAGDLDPTSPHVRIRWRIPKETIIGGESLELDSYMQRFDTRWPDEIAGLEFKTVEIQGLEDDGEGRICLSPDDDPAGCDKVYLDPGVFDGVTAAAIVGGYPPAGTVNPNDEHAIVFSGALYAGRDDAATRRPATATRPWVLLGHRTEADGPLVFEPFRVLRDINPKEFVVEQVVQLPPPYVYLANYPRCAGTRIENGLGQPLDPYFWRDPDGGIWWRSSWPRPGASGPASIARFDFHEWWFPENPDGSPRASGNDCEDWIANIDVTAVWPTEEGIGPGKYTALQVGEAIDLSSHQSIELLFSSNTGDSETAGVEVLVERQRDECSESEFFCTFRNDGDIATATPGVLKFVSAIGPGVRASPCDGAERWATLGTVDAGNPEVKAYQVSCPPVQGRIIPVGSSCGFSPVVRLRFWPLRNDPLEYGAQLLESGLYDESTIPEDLLDALYADAEGNLTFEWQYMSAADFNAGSRNWIPDGSTSGPVLTIDASSGVATILDRYYRVRYTGYDACSCADDLPPPATNYLEITGADDVLQSDGLPQEVVDVRDQSVDGGDWIRVGRFRTQNDGGGYSPITLTLRRKTQLEISQECLPGDTCPPVVGDAYADAVRFVHVPRPLAASPLAREATEYVHEAGEAGGALQIAALFNGAVWRRDGNELDLPGQSGASYLHTAASDEPFTWRFSPPDLANETEPDAIEEYDVWVRWPRVIEAPPGPGGTTFWYSYWTDTMLLPGWIKRVTQSFDLENFKLDSFVADGGTFVGALELIGPRTEEEIAFNCDPANLNELGLLELYENVLARGRGFSIDSGFNVADANQALLLIASRINQMYMLLGNEAYADAVDPTIGTTLGDGSDLEPEKYFAFHNQVPSLLEEELILLRGRARETTTIDFFAPVYNRFTWNFTSDLAKTIYATAYRDAGIVTVEDAMRKFPQGHGDAWGHYESATRLYYELLASGFFDWTNDDEHVLVAGRPVRVGFTHARHFARAAAARARTGRDVVALEFRRQYRADPQEQFTSQGYIDGHDDDALLVSSGKTFPAGTGEEERSWGVHDWATRAATAAYLDWAVVASRLPARSEEVGLKRVDRTTVAELDEIAANVREITQQVGIVDSGLNPLGLSRSVVPFDIDPNDLMEEGLTHFEQTLSKAVNAIGNSAAILQFANRSRNRLREQQDELEAFDRGIESEEFRLKSRLIEVFGRAYPEDPAYPPSYDGPDLLHFAYVDVGSITGLDKPTTVRTVELPFVEYLRSPFGGVLIEDGEEEVSFDGPDGATTISQPTWNLLLPDLDSRETRSVTFHYDPATRDVVKPETWTRARPEEGAIQQFLRQVHIAGGRLKQAEDTLRTLVQDITADYEYLLAVQGVQARELRIRIDALNRERTIDAEIESIWDELDTARSIIATARGLANVVAEANRMGFTFDITAPIRAIALTVGEVLTANQVSVDQDKQEDIRDEENRRKEHQLVDELELLGLSHELSRLDVVRNLESRLRSVSAAVIQINLAKEEFVQAVSGYGAAVGQGLRLIEERDRFRRQTIRQLRVYRQDDLTFRLFHNDALGKYRAGFELASRYAYLAVQTFDYETNLLGSGQHIGRFDDVDEALEAIIQARSPGALIAQTPAGGSGLTGVLFELDSAFETIKQNIRLPQTEKREFSLRRALFQVPPAGRESHRRFKDMLRGTGWDGEPHAEIVDDLRQRPDIIRLTQLHETLAFDEPQPALLLRFPTAILATHNFFNRETHGGDPGFSPEHLTTKILRCGVYFESYPHGKGRLSPIPYVYLVPAGASVMRVPLSTAPGVPKPLRELQLVDQLIPPVLSTFLDPGSQAWSVPDGSLLETDPDWRPGRLLQGCAGDTCFIGRPRKINPFIAGTDSSYLGNPRREPVYTGLVGRTAWNTEWLLVIPGRNLGAPGNDPALGIRTFLNGHGGGAGYGDEAEFIDDVGVTDIWLLMEAYSYENPY